MERTERSRKAASGSQHAGTTMLPRLHAGPGISFRHARRCGSGEGGRCTCTPTYQAQAWSARDGKPVRKTFKSLSEARAWRQEAQVALRRGAMNAPTPKLVRQAADDWFQA